MFIFPTTWFIGWNTEKETSCYSEHFLSQCLLTVVCTCRRRWAMFSSLHAFKCMWSDSIERMVLSGNANIGNAEQLLNFYPISINFHRIWSTMKTLLTRQWTRALPKTIYTNWQQSTMTTSIPPADQVIHQKSAIQKKLKKIVRMMAVTMMTTTASRSGWTCSNRIATEKCPGRSCPVGTSRFPICSVRFLATGIRPVFRRTNSGLFRGIPAGSDWKVVGICPSKNRPESGCKEHDGTYRNRLEPVGSSKDPTGSCNRNDRPGCIHRAHCRSMKLVWNWSRSVVIWIWTSCKWIGSWMESACCFPAKANCQEQYPAYSGSRVSEGHCSIAFRHSLLTLYCLLCLDIDCSRKVSYYCRECFHVLLTPQQVQCTYGCSMNGHRRPFKNVSEMVICDVKREILTTAKRYMPLIHEYSRQSKDVLPCDIPNGQASLLGCGCLDLDKDRSIWIKTTKTLRLRSIWTAAIEEQAVNCVLVFHGLTEEENKPSSYRSISAYRRMDLCNWLSRCTLMGHRWQRLEENHFGQFNLHWWRFRRQSGTTWMQLWSSALG